MKVGDLVMFRNCAPQGKIGIISMCTNPSPVAKMDPKLRLFWVFYDAGIQCFTGNQLVLV